MKMWILIGKHMNKQILMDMLALYPYHTITNIIMYYDYDSKTDKRIG
jgi:hypothetical protein